MRLAELQSALRDVLREGPQPVRSDDPELLAYMGKVVSSGRLRILTHVIASWRAYDLQRACPLTVAVLKERLSWEATLGNFANEAYSPFVEILADRFLEMVTRHNDGLVSSVASFERACRRVLGGSHDRFMVKWDRHPEAVLTRLASGISLDVTAPAGSYITTISRDLPNLFEVTISAPNLSRD